MTRQEAIDFIESSNGKILAIEFTKRTTGETRRMICRSGVKSHLVGGLGSGPAYNHKDKGLISVFDMQKVAFRCIPVEGITRVKVDNEWKEVK